MKKPRFAIVYFSATGVTQTYTKVIGEELERLGWAMSLENVTSYSSRKDSRLLEDIKYVIFGFPVYGDFAPSVINEWLADLDGKGKRCAMFFTYGGRTTGYAHFHTKLLLEQAGFQVLFSGEFLGPHSFNHAGWSVLPDRPSENDLNLAREFARLAEKRFLAQKPPVFKIQKPFGYQHAVTKLNLYEVPEERKWPHPARVMDNCQMCLDCQDQCPTGAFDAETGGSNLETCILCMHCVSICPDQVIRADEKAQVSTRRFLEYCHLTEEMLDTKRSKIISDPWDTVF